MLNHFKYTMTNEENSRSKNQLKQFFLFLALPTNRLRATVHTKRQFSDEEILSGIKHGDPEVFVFVKKQTLPFITAFIKQNKGSKAQAEEVFHDAMVVVFRKLKKGPVVLRSKFTTWFIGICKIIWRFNHKNGNPVLLNPVDIVDDEDEITDLYKESLEFDLYRKYFNKLPDKKQKILMASLSSTPYNELYQSFGYKSADVFKTEVARIRKQLIQSISADPDFQKYFNGKYWSV